MAKLLFGGEAIVSVKAFFIALKQKIFVLTNVGGGGQS